MAVNYSTNIKDAQMLAALAGIDNNAGPATMEICTAAYALVLCVITLSKPSFTEATQALTMAGAPKTGTASGTGTAAVARIKDGGGTMQVQGLVVGVGTGDVQLNSLSITSGQTVTISTGTITHAA